MCEGDAFCRKFTQTRPASPSSPLIDIRSSHNGAVLTRQGVLKEIHHYESVDANGLMLSSQKSTDSNPSTFVWKGNDLVQETAPDGTITHYNVVNGVLVSFERAGMTYTPSRAMPRWGM